MSFILLYWLFLKASLSSFNGLASLPIVRNDLVVQLHLITDRQMTTAVAIGQVTPGPLGLYMVSAGYYAAGFRGALAAWMALTTPALLVIPLMSFAGQWARHPRVQGMLRAVVLASAGVSLAATLPLSVDALHSPASFCIAGASLLLLTLTKVDMIWIVLGSSGISLLISFFSR